jgi:prepilin-type N-terminal cleavage/methylation domain-containing protein
MQTNYQKGSRNKNRSKGFTLIEILVVIGIIAVLATVVLVAVNPARQFKLARDSQRVANINAILNAIGQNIAEHKGTFNCPTTSNIIPNTPTLIAAGPSYFDMASCVVPAYISSLPFDPNPATGGFWTSTDVYNTGYDVTQDANGQVTITANGELTPVISVSR